MDLGIKGRRALVCASSKGLGRGCAMALAEAKVDVVINGRDEKALAEAAAKIAKATGVKHGTVKSLVLKTATKPAA